MVNVRVARRYAEALVELAEEQKSMGAMIKDLELLRESIVGSRDLVLFLKSPIIGKSRKRDVLQSLFAGKVQKSTIEALGVIALKGREDLLPDIIDQFFSIWDERQGIVRVDVKTASELSGEQSATLGEKLEHFTQKKVRLTFGLDKQLMGGFVARVGDTVFDGSVKRQLELLRKRFAEGNGIN
jgi:F-type H+-transporting ATPase subunit delta